MRLANITPQILATLKPNDLLETWKRMSFIWDTENPDKEEFLEKTLFVLNEFKRRNLTPDETKLYKAAEEFKTKREQEAIQEAVRQPFGSPGGKRYMADRLVRMFPEHQTYVEVFAGGLACFWKKKESVKEVINDKDPDIIMAYRTIKALTPEQWTTLQKMNWKATEVGFNQTRESMKTSTGLQRFHDFIYLKQFSDVAEMKSYDNRDDQKSWAGVKNLMKMKERIKNVEICNMDYSEVIRRFDSPTTFFYVDPPYPTAKLSWKWMPETKEIEEVVGGIKGKWLLSYELTDAFSKFNKTRVKLWAIAHPSQHHKGNVMKQEQLVCNYKIEQNTRYLHESCITTGSDWFNMFFEYFTDNGYAKNWSKLKEETKLLRVTEAADKLAFEPKNELMRADAIRALREAIMPTIEKVLTERFQKAYIKESTRFALQHQWWKGDMEHWDLRLTTARKDYIHFELEYSPLTEKEIVGLKRDFRAVEDAWMTKGVIIERINSGEIGNKIANNPCWVEMLDRGKVIIEEETETVIRLKFAGKKLQGAWIIEKDASSSDRWILKKQEQNPM